MRFVASQQPSGLDFCAYLVQVIKIIEFIIKLYIYIPKSKLLFKWDFRKFLFVISLGVSATLSVYYLLALYLAILLWITHFKTWIADYIFVVLL